MFKTHFGQIFLISIVKNLMQQGFIPISLRLRVEVVVDHNVYQKKNPTYYLNAYCTVRIYLPGCCSMIPHCNSGGFVMFLFE